MVKSSDRETACSNCAEQLSTVYVSGTVLGGHGTRGPTSGLTVSTAPFPPLILRERPPGVGLSEFGYRDK